MRTVIFSLAAASLALPAVPAVAQDWRGDRGWRDYDRGGSYYRDNRRDNRRVYDSRGRYVEPRRVSQNDRVWRGNDGRYYCQRSNGTTGLIIGAAGGALLGREIDGGRDRTLGTILGAAAGGLLGREIQRGNARCQ